MCPSSTVPSSTSIYFHDYPIPVVVPYCDEGVFVDDMASILPMKKEKKEKVRRPVTLPMIECAAFVNATPSSSTVSSDPQTPDSGFSSDDSLNPEACSPLGAKMRLERSKTLPSALRKPHRTPSRSSRKSVRFADAMGLDLAELQYFVRDEELLFSMPILTSSATPSFSSAMRLRATNFVYRPESETLAATRSSGVAVAALRPIGGGHVAGQVNVVNLAYDKKITIRYSMDGWKSQSEISAAFSHRIFGTEDIDAFNFMLIVPAEASARCEMCVAYGVQDVLYWDSNGGQNYVIEWKAHDDEKIPQSEEPIRGSRVPASAAARLRSLSPLSGHVDDDDDERRRPIDRLPARADFSSRGRRRWGHSVKAGAFEFVPNFY